MAPSMAGEAGRTPTINDVAIPLADSAARVPRWPNLMVACAEHWSMARARTLELLLLFLVTCAYTVPVIAPAMLAVQLSLMATLVWRSSLTETSAPAPNTLRAVVGSLVLAGGEATVLRAHYHQPSAMDTWTVRMFPIAVHMATAYAAMAISDYMFHRFIWHACGMLTGPRPRGPSGGACIYTIFSITSPTTNTAWTNGQSQKCEH